MNYFTIIIILYIIFYVVLTIISATRERKKREKRREILEKERVEEKTIPYKEDYIKTTTFKEIFEEELKETPEEKKLIEKIEEEKITPEKIEVVTPPSYEKEKIVYSEYEKEHLKLKKLLTLSKNDILKGIIFKEILTTKFKK